MEETPIFSLFSSCIPVKGHGRSIICDVFRVRFRYIPNALYYILTKYKNCSIREIKAAFENNHDNIIDDYFKLLEEEEFGHYVNEKEIKLFPKLNLDIEFPSIITNAIIDIGPDSNHNYEDIFHQFGILKCYFWEMRFYVAVSCHELGSILNQRKKTPIRSIQLILKYHPDTTIKSINALYNDFPISQINIHSAPENKIKRLNNSMKDIPVIFHSTEIDSELHCGKFTINDFRPNLNLFGESQKHNSCLNQKISIDVNGEIKNCPSMQESFGNIKNTSLSEVLTKPHFKKHWNITKDQVSICKDCEFRYICTDCRAYVENPEDQFSKPLKCGYDPYTTKWEKWSTHPLKQKAIEHYKMEELILCE